MRGANWPTQEKAATPIRQGRTFTERKKGRRNGKKKEKKLLKIKTAGRRQVEKVGSRQNRESNAIARDAAQLRCSPCGQRQRKGKPDGLTTTLLTTLIGAAAHG